MASFSGHEQIRTGVCACTRQEMVRTRVSEATWIENERKRRRGDKITFILEKETTHELNREGKLPKK